LRNLTRYRKVQIEERTREVRRLEKVLQEAGIKLSCVATRVLGVSGRAFAQKPSSKGLLTPRSWPSLPEEGYTTGCAGTPLLII
jgi:hypothetical protein